MRIDVKGLTKSFGSRHLFSNLNCSFKPGQVNVILGESGSGKTTLLNILALFEQPDAGKVLYDGREVTNLKKSELRKLIRITVGYIYQDIRLFENLSVYENLFLAMKFTELERSQRRKTADELLEKVGLKDYGNKTAGTLSGGEKQRVAIARALAGGKKLLFADEPTGALDEENAMRITELLNDVAQKNGCTIIMVTHSLTVAGRFSSRFRMTGGQLMEDALAKNTLVKNTLAKNGVMKDGVEIEG